MPVYEYLCNSCGDFTAVRRVSERDAECACPQCGQAASRVLLTAPKLAVMSSAQRAAYATNERSAHAPLTSTEYQERQRHGPGCSCCNGAKNRKTHVSADGAKSFPGTRPWMISH
ncbi:MAG TPA: FmdB family transcriptional regulator [Pusillimonas sp.]|nr:FmdB family transcriptional regulator [Pusillimonas sp.]MBC41744.1 FmdB family transcriptional regulator [Pusillimonas sp.]HBT34243.1 FmdB family transcriptional regulator [Pusillimonas sp.]HCN71156.1 FmdB family transcriptional regulator [Pusillimonas sp.]HCP77742.1 FmdB family transcriptional regulator [Pusillimonas sp.]